MAALRVAQLGLDVLDVLFESLQLAVAYLSHALIVAFAFSPLRLKLQLLHLLLVLLNFVHQPLLALPFCTERLLLVLQIGNVLVELCNLVGIVLALYGFAFDLELF